MPSAVANSRKPAMAVTVDLEEYFQVEAMAGLVRPQDWDSLPARVETSTRRVLELFAAAGAHGTFFVVGWVAERYPRLIAEVAAAGHELGCHSYWHRPVFRLTPDEFREDTRRAKAAIEQAAGVEVTGYRAPNFSIRLRGPAPVHDMEWAWDILAEAGFTYDSSIHPIHHPLYGAAHAPRLPFKLQRQGLWEFPLATAQCLGQRWPVAGGAYWRLGPRAYTRVGLARAQRQCGRLVTYLHPWELDPQQPRLGLRGLQRWRHYGGQRGLAATLGRLLHRYGSQPMQQLFQIELATDFLPKAVRA